MIRKLGVRITKGKSCIGEVSLSLEKKLKILTWNLG